MRDFSRTAPDTSGWAYRFRVDDPPDRIDHVRGFPHSYEVDEHGMAYGLDPSTGWARGELVRSTVPVVAPRAPIPMYDPTIMRDPNEWAPRNLT